MVAPVRGAAPAHGGVPGVRDRAVRCEGCGAEAPALKTLRWKHSSSQRGFSLCDPCYSGVAGEVWIVRGPVPCWGQCRSCSEWFSVNELEDRVGGGRWDSPTGVCPGCNGVGSPAPVR